MRTFRRRGYAAARPAPPLAEIVFKKKRATRVKNKIMRYRKFGGEKVGGDTPPRQSRSPPTGETPNNKIMRYRKFGGEKVGGTPPRGKAAPPRREKHRTIKTERPQRISKEIDSLKLGRDASPFVMVPYATEKIKVKSLRDAQARPMIFSFATALKTTTGGARFFVQLKGVITNEKLA